MAECLIIPHSPSTEKMVHVMKYYLLRIFIAWTVDSLLNVVIAFEIYYWMNSEPLV